MNTVATDEAIPATPAEPATAAGDEPMQASGVGDRLRHARESKGLTVADVSQAIKIGPRVIEQIEANAWGALSGHTFARGVVRSYARFLHLDAESLLKDLEDAPLPKPPLLELPKSTRAALPVPGEAQKRDRVAMFSGVLMVALAIVAYVLVPDDWFSRKATGRASGNAPAATADTVAPVGGPAAPANPSPQSPPSDVSSGTVVLSVPGPAVRAGEAAPGPVVPDAAPGTQPLVLVFVQESWAEIRDKTGAILISENVAAGAERRLGGEPPYNIWLGNADGVRLAFRGQSVDLAPHTRQKVARLTLE